MKIKVLYSITALLILTLSVVVFAYTGNPTSIKTDSCCAMKDCCKDGKCKMGGECCKDKDSCPMMNKDSKEMSSMNHEDCCKDGKCDMKAHKKDGEATAMKGDCCKGKDSCPMMNKGENKDTNKTN